MRNYGQEKKYYHSELGWNSQLIIQAIVLMEKLKLLDEWDERHDESLPGIMNFLKKKMLLLILNHQKNEAVHHLFVVTLKKSE